MRETNWIRLLLHYRGLYLPSGTQNAEFVFYAQHTRKVIYSKLQGDENKKRLAD